MSAGDRSAARRQLVVFRVGGERMAADVFAVERVLRYTTPRMLPSEARWLRGVVEHRGAALPIVDLRERLGMGSSAPGSQSRVLVVAVGESKVGVLVDAVEAVRSTDAAAIEAPPAPYRGLAREYLEGVVRDGEDLIVLLETQHLLTSTERIEMERTLATRGANG